MAEIRHLESGHDVILFCRRWSDLDKMSETVAEWHVNCDDLVEIEIRCRIPIWRMFGQIQWHVIPQQPATLQGAATWQIQCHDSRATCHCRVLPPGEFNSMSSQSHVSHCRVLPLGEFNVTIPELHATLQGAATWRNQCHDHVTLQGVKIPSAILKIVFHHILFCFWCSFSFDRAAAFVSSAILYSYPNLKETAITLTTCPFL